MNRLLFLFGLVLLIPGIFSLDAAFSTGPASWAVNQSAFWGTPIANFVFWIGLAHAGTFFSAILLVLGTKWQHRIAFQAEISTVAALAVAAIFPLVHLGIPLRFYYLIPLGVARTLYVNIESPLIWDFIAIFVYFLLSLCYLALHILASKKTEVGSFRKPLAWVLFPLLLWVHTIVSLDFAVTQVPGWQGAYFPFYFIAGALYSGIALILVLLEAGGKRVRTLEDLLLAFSWALLAFWLWGLAIKGVWHPEVLVFGFLLPQLLWIPIIRENKKARIGVGLSVLFALWWERIELVTPKSPDWTLVDFGFIAFGVGAFLVLYSGIRGILLSRYPRAFDEEDETLADIKQPLTLTLKSSITAWGIGILVSGSFAFYFISSAPEFPLYRLIPVLFPLVTLVAGVSLFLMAASLFWNKRIVICSTFAVFILLLGVAGLIYKGTGTVYNEPQKVISSEPVPQNSRPAKVLWNSYCTACHGTDGTFNRKFVHEYYPLPQKLSLSRLDSIGEDSLVQVILNGRNYMSAYRGRVSEEEARALFRLMHGLSEEAK